MREELSNEQSAAIQGFWDQDISVGGAPDGWTMESFKAKVENLVWDGWSFKRATMMVLSQVPRPDDVKSPKVQLASEITDKVAALKAAKRKAFIDATKAEGREPLLAKDKPAPTRRLSDLSLSD